MEILKKLLPSHFSSNLSTPGLDRNKVDKLSSLSQAFVRPPAILIAPARTRPHWRAPLKLWCCKCAHVWCVA